MITPDSTNAWDLNDPDLFSAIDEAPLWSVPFGLVLLDTVVLKPNLAVLDVGCGLGYPVLELAGRLGTTSRLYGLDPSAAALVRMQFKMTQQGISNVTACVGTAEAMPFEDEFFDLIVSNNGLNNVADRDKSLKECFRAAKPGAQFVITENLPDTMREFYDIYERVLRELGFVDRVAAMHAHIHSKRKSQERTRDCIIKTGFNIQSIETHSFTLRYLNGSAMLNHFLIRLAFLESFQRILDEKDRRPVFEILEARLNEQAEKQGQLLLTIPFVCFDCWK